MAQVNMNAWQQGSQMYRDSLDRERQAQQDAMQAKRFGWEEEKVNRERSAYDETQRIGGETRRMLEEDAAPAQMFGDNGFTGMREAPDAAYGPPAMAANPVANNPTTSDAANPVANNLAQGLQEGLGRLGKQRQMLLSVYDMARANNDRQTMAAVTGQIQTLNTATQRANIFNQVYSNPEMAAGIASNLTRNPAIPLKAKTDANGVTTLVRDDGSSAGKLTPDQMAMVAVHMWDMRSGDIEGGRKGLASINKELADAVTAQNSAVNVEATSANAGLKLGSELESAQAQREYYGANAARTKAAAEREANPKQAAIADLEGVLGRKLTKQERERAAGMDREESAEMKAKLAGLEQMNKNGQFQTPADYNKAVDGLFQEQSDKRATARAQQFTTAALAGLRRAQEAGDLDTAVAELKTRKVPDATIQELLKQLNPDAGPAGAAPGSKLPPPTNPAAPARPVRQIGTITAPRTGAEARGLSVPRPAPGPRSGESEYEYLLRVMPN